jgi:Transmembrane domain of unknown function (DUF3566)
MRTLVAMSQTERLDEAADELDDEFLDDVDRHVGSDVDVHDGFDAVPVDDAGAAEPDVADDIDDIDEIAEIDETADTADEPYVLPEITPATEDEGVEPQPGADPLIARRSPAEKVDDSDALDQRTPEPDVSVDVLEELRRADIDGPTVAFAPQDDTSAAIRRPRRSPEYDPAPFPIPLTVPRLLGRKPRVRRVTRVVRHVDPWSVFKIAIVANLVMYLILLTAGVLLWNVAYATGTVDNVERFFESFGWSSFEFNGGELYHNAWIGGLFLVIGFTGLAVLFATLFNLITDLVGGMRFTVLEEEVVEARTSPMRRFVVRRAEPEVPLVTYDASGPIIREGVIDDSGSIQR